VAKRKKLKMFDEDLTLQRDAVFNIGKVISVEGRRIRISVSKLKNSSHLLYQGDIVRNVAVGGFVKIAKGFVELVAVVDGEHVEEDRASTSDYKRSVDNLTRELDARLVGYFKDSKFYSGVREMPLLDNECFILTEPEFREIHTFVGNTTPAIPLGVLVMEPTQPVLVGVDAIFASHVGIFGNTGSGKSYTLAKLYHELFKKYGDQPGFVGHSKFVLIDFNGEYVNRAPEVGTDNVDSSSVIVGSELKSEYRLSTRAGGGDRLPLPRSAVHDPVFWSILLDATEKTQAPFVNRVLRSDYLDRLLPDGDALLDVIGVAVARATKSTDPTMDRLLPLNFLDEILDCLDGFASQSFQQMVQDFKTNLGYYSKTHNFYWGPYLNPQKWSTADDWDDFVAQKFNAVTQDFSSVGDVDLIRFKLVLQYYNDVIVGFINREHIGPLMKRLDSRIDGIKKLIEVSEESIASKPLTVISLRNVNLDMRKILPMILCRHLYEVQKTNDQSEDRYLNIIIDEAHNILSFDSVRESETWRDYRLETFEEIIKEGRKFGVFLTIASQRPHDISPAIISQLHNYFLHRLVNELDIKAVEKAVSYLDRVSFESMPILPIGTCIFAGVAAQIPVMVAVGELEPRFAPDSRTLSISELWLKPHNAKLAVEEVTDDPF
jgi:DNA helicase HerA-like ATPase